MSKFYEVEVHSTAKTVGSKDESWQRYDDRTEQFATLDGVKQWLDNAYNKTSRQKMYRDTKDGAVQHVGYIYKLGKQPGYGSDPDYYQQDWVEVKEIKAKTILI